MDGFKLYPYTLGQIADLGEKRYAEYCGVLLLEMSQRVRSELPAELDELSDFQLFSLIMKTQEDLQQTFLAALQSIAGEVEVSCVNGAFFVGEVFLSETKLRQMRDFVRTQNLIAPEPEYSFADEQARKIQAKIEANRAEIERIKQRQVDDTPDFVDLITGLVIKSEGAIDFTNVWNLTYYQFRALLARTQAIDNYDLGVKQLLAGAESKKVDLQHWLNKIEINT